MNKLELKGRLLLIANMVSPCDILTDVGTDHGYIPIYLVEKGICSKAIACDVRKGPLNIAKRNIEEFQLTELIETRLGSGLEPISYSESDVFVIAGMGGLLIRDILLKDIDKARKAKRLVLQPMNAIEVLREWLYTNGFDIFDEALVQEEHKIYNVIVAKWTDQTRYMREIDYHIGEQLVKKHDRLLESYLMKKLKQLDNTIIGLKKAEYKDMEAINSKLKLREEMNDVLNIIKNYSPERRYK